MAQLTQEQMKKSRDASVADGTLYSVMAGAGESYIVPFAIALGANPAFSALISAFPQFVAAMVQLLAVPLSGRLSNRKNFIIAGAILQALVWVPLAALAFFAPEYALTALIALYCIYVSLAVLLNPIWSGWMADIVPEHERGQYFSRRNAITLAASVASALFAGWLLGQYAGFEGGGAGWVEQLLAGLFAVFSPAGKLGGFAIVFLVALGARILSSTFLMKMEDGGAEHELGENIGIIELFGSPAQKESGRFALYMFFLMAATYVGTPFVTIYLLTSLKLDMFTYSIIAVGGSAAKFLTLRYWGQLSDRFGPRSVFVTTGLLIPFAIAGYVVWHEPVFLLASEMFSGVVWGGFELACFNFVLGRSEKSHRIAAVSAYNLSKGVGLFAGTVAGIALFAHFAAAPLLENAFVSVFLVSVMLRLIASVAFLPHFSEGSFGGMSMGKFLWQALAVNPSAGIGGRLTRTFFFGMHFFHNSAEYGGQAAKGGLDLAIYMLKRGPIMIGKRIRIRRGL